jgi:hypothetical protein
MPITRTIQFFTAALFTITATACAGLPDLRPEQVLDGVTQAESDRARALIDRAAELSGGRELLNQHDAFQAVFLDVWTNRFAKALFLEYDPNQRISVYSENPDVSNVRMTLVNGDRAGEVWGLEDNKVFIERDGAREFTDDVGTMLYIKNPAALVLIPLRLAWADKVAYTGSITHEGKNYETVFATWETFEPNETFDQWVLWFDPDTGYLAKAHLTVRETGGGPVKEGAIDFAHYKRFGDVVVPTKISALFSIDGSSLRTYNLESFEWIDAPREQASR